MADDIYHDAIMTLARDGRYAGEIENADASATISNPLCGDRVRIDVAVDGGRIAALRHKVRGCALCQAAAAVIGAHGAGATGAEISDAAAAAQALLAGDAAGANAWPELDAFAPVAAVKSRHDCVMLPFRAALEALDQLRDADQVG